MNTKTQNDTIQTSETVKAENTFWDKIVEKSPFLKFTPENNYTLKVKFLGNNPDEQMNQFGSVQYNFECIDKDDKDPHISILSVSSNRLMLELKKHSPLDEKEFVIHRTGTGFKTEFQVVKTLG